MRPCLLLSFIFLIIPAAYGEGGPFATEIRGDVGSFISRSPGEFRVNVRTVEGIHEFAFREANNRGQRDSRDAILFRGRLINRPQSSVVRGASADIIGRRLRLIFHGRRRARLTTITADIRPLSAGAEKLAARVSYVSPARNFACGQQFHQQTRLSPPTLSLTGSSPIYDPPRLIKLATDADAEFFDSYGTDSNAEIQAIVNAAESIYASQLGIRFQIIRQRVFTDPAAQPYTSASPVGLLLQFALHNQDEQHPDPADAYHLFTGKTMDDGILGVAFLGSICQTNINGQPLAFGITQNVSAAIQALVTAHEIGHKLNARHPEEVLDPAPPPSLMSGIIQPGNSTFSSFSLGEITSFIDTMGHCLKEALPRITLSASLRRTPSPSRRRFRAVVRRQDTLGDQCEINLYASAIRRRLRSNDLERGRQVAGRLIMSDAELFRTTMRRGIRRQRPIFFRASINCPNYDLSLSNISRVELTPFRDGKIGTRQWISNLKRRLQN